MIPIRSAAPLSPLTPDSQAVDVVRAVSEQSLQTQRSLHQWQPGSLCTEDGRVFSVLTMPRSEPLLETMPPDVYLDPGSAETRFTAQAHLQAAQWRIEGLKALTMTHSWQPVTVDSNGDEVEAYAQFLGFSRAVPLVAHWLPQSKQWLCIGGKITHPRGVEVIVETTKLELAAGFLGLRYYLRGGEWQDTPIYDRAEWVAVKPESNSESLMGQLNPSTLERQPSVLFIPFYAVTTEPVRRLAVNFALLAPTHAQLYAPALGPVNTTGTLLNT